MIVGNHAARCQVFNIQNGQGTQVCD
jgi:hypothetical protein